MSAEGIQLANEVARLSAEEAALTCRLIVKIGELDASGEWAQQGAISCAHWLGWRVGLALPAARERVRVARALRELPQITEAFGTGTISYSKVRALVRVATPDNETDLVDIARSTTASGLERICARFRSVLDLERAQRETPEEAEARRYVYVRTHDNGSVLFSVQLPADEAARFIVAVESARELAAKGADSPESGAPPRTPDDDASEPPRLSADQRNRCSRRNRADGLMVMVERFLSADEVVPRRGGAPHEVILHVNQADLEAQAEGAFLEGAECTGVSAETARRLSCDAGVVEVVEGDNGEVLNVGRRRRTIPSAIQRALRVRDQGRCAYPGCTHHLFLDAHHIHHWAAGGETSLDNLVLLCRRHHTFVHEHGYRIERDALGRIVVSPPGQAPIPRAPAQGPCPSDIVERIAIAHIERGLSLNEVCLIPPHYDGSAPDMALVVQCLLEASHPTSPRRHDQEEHAHATQALS